MQAKKEDSASASHLSEAEEREAKEEKELWRVTSDLEARVGALFVVVLVADLGGDNLVRDLVELLELLAVEERGGLFERPVPRLDDEEVQEDGLKREPAAVHDLQQDKGRQRQRQLKCRA